MTAFVKFSRIKNKGKILINTRSIIEVEPIEGKQGKAFTRITYGFDGSRNYGDAFRADVEESFDQVETILREAGENS